MTLRTFVSFEADFPTDGSPAGRELAEFVAHVLRSDGQAISGPTNREDWAWDIRCKVDKTVLNSIVGFSDDGPRQWQIHTHRHRPVLQRFFGGGNASQEKLLGSYCSKIHNAIKHDSRFRNIRWYEQVMFEKDHGDTWADAP